jgi:hypothetical protein
LLALLASGKAAGGHAGFGPALGGLGGLATSPAGAAGAGVPASHALFGPRPGGFAGKKTPACQPYLAEQQLFCCPAALECCCIGPWLLWLEDVDGFVALFCS